MNIFAEMFIVYCSIVICHFAYCRESWQMYSNISPPEIHDEGVFSVIVQRPDQGLVYAPGSSIVNS